MIDNWFWMMLTDDWFWLMLIDNWFWLMLSDWWRNIVVGPPSPSQKRDSAAPVFHLVTKYCSWTPLPLPKTWLCSSSIPPGDEIYTPYNFSVQCWCCIRPPCLWFDPNWLDPIKSIRCHCTGCQGSYWGSTWLNELSVDFWVIKICLKIKISKLDCPVVTSFIPESKELILIRGREFWPIRSLRSD